MMMKYNQDQEIKIAGIKTGDLRYFNYTNDRMVSDKPVSMSKYFKEEAEATYGVMTMDGSQ